MNLSKALFEGLFPGEAMLWIHIRDIMQTLHAKCGRLKTKGEKVMSTKSEKSKL